MAICFLDGFAAPKLLEVSLENAFPAEAPRAPAKAAALFISETAIIRAPFSSRGPIT